jgi:hypothetical protein
MYSQLTQLFFCKNQQALRLVSATCISLLIAFQIRMEREVDVEMRSLKDNATDSVGGKN